MWNSPKYNSFHINLLQCYASHLLKQVCCLALAVIIFCLTIVACYVSISFLNACYVGFRPVFFCTYQECKALVNHSGSPQGHPWLDILSTPCCVHVVYCHSAHAKAFALPVLKSYCHTNPGICWAIILSSIIHSTHPSMDHHPLHLSIIVPTVLECKQAGANAPMCARIAQLCAVSFALAL